MEQKDDTLREWCAGLPLVETRALTPDEAISLRREAKHGRVRGCGLIAGTPFGCLGIIVLMALLTELVEKVSQSLAWIPAMLFLVPGLIGAAWALLSANDLFEKGKQSERDLRIARVLLFRGTPDQVKRAAAVNNPTALQLLSRLVRNQEQPSFEVLAGSRRVWTINGRAPKKRFIAPASHVADVPQGAQIAALWALPLRRDAQGVLQSDNVAQRALSASEKAELLRRARRMWLRPLWPALFFAAWIIVPLLFAFFLKQPIGFEKQVYFLGALSVLTGFKFFQGLQLALKLNHDARAGFVLILRPPPEELPTQESQVALSEVLEVLPESQCLWTQNGEAADWRKLPD